MKKIIMAGCPRSGTTALCTLLSHGNCFISNEVGNFVWDEDSFPERVKDCAEKYYLNFLLEMKNISKKSFIETVGSSPKEYCENISDKYGIEVVGDKMPGYIEHLVDIFNENRDAYFVITLRDVRHFVASSTNRFNAGERSGWCFETIEEAQKFWVTQNLNMLNGVHHILKNKGKAILVRYEDIGKDIDQTIKRIEDFIHYKLDVPNPNGGFIEVNRKFKPFNPSDSAKMLMSLFGYSI